MTAAEKAELAVLSEARRLGRFVVCGCGSTRTIERLVASGCLKRAAARDTYLLTDAGRARLAELTNPAAKPEAPFECLLTVHDYAIDGVRHLEWGVPLHKLPAGRFRVRLERIK